MSFFETLIEELINEGNTVDIASNIKVRVLPKKYYDLGCKVYNLSCSRSLFDKGNIKAFYEINRIVLKGKYDIVHCHTPIAGAITRLACKNLRKDGLRVFYTAHGFHFYKGAPLLNWIIYYPIEKYCSRFTDVLITINHEDFELAKKKMKAKRIEYVPGVGIDVDKFANTVVDRKAKRRELGIPEDAFVLLSVGELNKNKNHQIVIKAIAKISNPDIHYMIAGQGPLHDYLLDLANNLGISKQVHLLGYRNDVAELYKTADVNVFPSIREGFGLTAIEGMASGLPLICINNRGTREYAENKTNSIMCSNSLKEFVSAISVLYQDKYMRTNYSNKYLAMVRSFDILRVNELMMKMYHSNN